MGRGQVALAQPHLYHLYLDPTAVTAAEATASAKPAAEAAASKCAAETAKAKLAEGSQGGGKGAATPLDTA